MRRSSLITIILLVLIIIGLSVALVLTNLPKKVKEENASTTTESNYDIKGEEENKRETPTLIDLNDEIVKEMADFLKPNIYDDYFFDKWKDPKKMDELENTQKMQIAYYRYVKNNLQYEGDDKSRPFFYKSDLDKGMMLAFGNIDYEPSDLMVPFIGYDYDSANEKFVCTAQGGGGGPYGIWTITGVYKVEEYSDRYEAYSKYMVIYPTDSNVTDFETKMFLGGTWRILASTSIKGKELGTYKDFETGDNRYGTYIGDYVAGVSEKPIVFSEFGGATGTYSKELMYKHFDEVSEYKTTFMKADDGTFYWLQTERIK